jgi:hypothetical protein
MKENTSPRRRRPQRAVVGNNMQPGDGIEILKTTPLPWKTVDSRHPSRRRASQYHRAKIGPRYQPGGGIFSFNPAPFIIASTNGASGSLTYTANVTIGASAGNIIVGVTTNNETVTPASVQDSKDNVYTLIGTSDTNNQPVWVYQAQVETPLVAGTDTISVTVSADTVNINLAAVNDPLGRAIDVSVANAATTGTTASVSTGALASVTDHLLAFAHVSTYQPTWQPPTTQMLLQSGNGAGYLITGYQLSPAETGVTPDATWSATTTWSAVVVTFTSRGFNQTGQYTDPYYTTNLCPNPSMETSIEGWSATDPATTLTQNTTVGLYGGACLAVTTDGSRSGQGTFGPGGQAPPLACTGSMTVSVMGETGTLNISAIANQDGTLLSTTTLILDGSGWQTVVLNDLAFGSFDLVYLAVTTAYPQAIMFSIDGVMYEPESPGHVYCDGDQYGCTWEGTPELSPSYQQYQYSISAALGFHLSGYLDVIEPGEIFALPAASDLEFTFTFPESAPVLSAYSPPAALTDFGIWELTDPDPAMTYGWWTNSGTDSGQLGYTRPYAMVVPPLDYPVSNGQYAWRRAAYCAVGFSWASVPTGVQQVLTDVQLEYARTAPGVATLPSAYQHPRQLQVIVKPNRLNYITNPSFAVNTTGWSGIGGSETLAQDSTQYPVNLATYDNISYDAGTQSCRVTLNGVNDSGIQISVPYLIPGDVYTASCYVLPGTQIGDILVQCEGAYQDLAQLIQPQYAYGGVNEGYGDGPYGGIGAANSALPTGTWTRVSFSFTATSDTGLFQIQAIPVTGTILPVTFWAAAVLLEPGDILMSYFDGNSGSDALWESGGQPGLSRSYYYNQYEYGQGIVTTALNSNTPLGISYAVPLYATPPLQ